MARAQLNVTVDPGLLAAVSRAAMIEGQNKSQWVTDAIQARLGFSEPNRFDDIEQRLSRLEEMARG